MSQPKLRVGVIGCGGMARNHVRGYLNTDRFKVVGLADLHPAAMDEYDAEFSLSTTHYADGREMLDREHLDVVSIGTWHRGHAPWTIAAAARQPKAILCEKPMADSLQGAEQMLIACRRNDVKLAIGHQRRFLPSYTRVRELIEQGAIGEVQWMQSFGKDGLPNYCVHQTDMYRYILGDDVCEWVMGNVERKTDRWERSTRIEDGAVAVFQFRCGARACILSHVTPTVYQGAHVYGSAGMIAFSTTEVRLLNAETGGTWRTEHPDGRFFRLDEQGRRFEWLEGATAQADELADWIEGRIETHRNCGENGYQALEMIHAVYESARCHEKVVLPLETRVNPLDAMVESGHLAPQRLGRYEIRAFRLRGEEMWTDDDGRLTCGQ
jgi:predicted dehydrogenase